jgi:hypothetical protein
MRSKSCTSDRTHAPDHGFIRQAPENPGSEIFCCDLGPNLNHVGFDFTPFHTRGEERKEGLWTVGGKATKVMDVC